MQVSEKHFEDVAEGIIYRFENLLCNNDVKLNNLDPKEDKFASETSYINNKDHKELREFIITQLKQLIEYYDIISVDAA